LINVSPDRADRHPTSATNVDAGKHAAAHQVIDPGPAHPSDSATSSGLNSNRSVIILLSDRLGFGLPRVGLLVLGLWQMDLVGGPHLADGTELNAVSGIDDNSRFMVSAKLVIRAAATHPIEIQWNRW
jgi:hypothetical protein